MGPHLFTNIYRAFLQEQMHVLQNAQYWRSNLETFIPTQSNNLEIKSQLYAHIT